MTPGARAHLLVTAAITIAFVGLDLLWLPYSNVICSPANWVELINVGGVLSGTFAISILIDWRLKDDQATFAVVLRQIAARAKLIVLCAAAFIPLAIATTIFMYLAAATDRPLMDATLASIDAALGFDWLRFLAVANTPLAGQVLVWAYHLLGPQIPALLILHAIRNRADRMMEIVALMAVSSIFTGLLMALVPAEGAYAFFNPPPDMYEHFTTQAGMWHHATLTALRSGMPFDLIFSQGSGLVTFPSFHTALGIMMVYSARDYRMIWVPLAVVNSVMIVGTLPEGGHHLVDVIAGCAVGLASVVIVRVPEQKSYRLLTARS